MLLDSRGKLEYFGRTQELGEHVNSRWPDQGSYCSEATVLTAAPSCHTLQIQYQSIGQSNVRHIQMQFFLIDLMKFRETSFKTFYIFRKHFYKCFSVTVRHLLLPILARSPLRVKSFLVKSQSSKQNHCTQLH